MNIGSLVVARHSSGRDTPPREWSVRSNASLSCATMCDVTTTLAGGEKRHGNACHAQSFHQPE